MSRWMRMAAAFFVAGSILAINACGGGGGSSSTPTPSSGSTGGSVSSPPTYTQKAIAGIFAYPGGVAVDANGSVFVADTINNKVKEIPFSGGSYGTPVTLGSGYYSPYGVAVDAKANVFVADFHGTVTEILRFRLLINS
jgi:sugar lactone lactonase YvrE